jgi:hypothetical protein
MKAFLCAPDSAEYDLFVQMNNVSMSTTGAWPAGMARFACHDPANVFDCIPCDVVASVVILSASALHTVD